MTKQDKKLPTPLLWIIGIFVVLGIWIGAWYFLLWSSYKLNWLNKGTFGDIFSAVSALFSGLAFVAVVITLYLQSKSIISSKKDLEKQSFENKFFQLLNIQNQILNGIEKPQKIDGNDVFLKGKLVFKILYEELINSYKSKSVNSNKNEILKKIQNTYKVFFKNYQSEFGHYFRHLYHIVKFINESTISDKQFYSNLLRAQLSSPELLLLFYNCLSEYGNERFKPLVEKYALLENMPNDTIDKRLDIDENHKIFYYDGAYEESGKTTS